MLYVFCVFEGSRSDGSYKAKHVCISPHDPDSDDPIEEAKAHSDVIKISVPGDDVGSEHIINNVLLAGGATTKFIG